MPAPDRATPLIGAVEAGGTKFVCGIGSVAHGSIETVRITTGRPDDTLREVVDFFHAAQARHGPIAGLGIGSFGPLDLDSTSPTFGRITATPKPGWRDVDMPAVLGAALSVPTSIDTDVNAAALAEARFGAGQGKATVAYVTIGTGIGVGVALDGRVRHAGAHAEAGHLRLGKHPAHRDFAGICPFHGDCLEGLASGPAIEACWGRTLADMPPDHIGWAAQADYLGRLCAALVLTLAPDVIVLGGGVMAQHRLLDEARDATARILAGYIERLARDGDFARLIVAPGCVEPSGLVGAYLLADHARAGN